jgi:hypothetical protein
MPERQRRRDPGDADILRRRNQVLTARIRELEDALAKAGGSVGNSPGSSDPLRTDEEGFEDVDDHTLVETFGTLTIEETGRTVWHGK